MLLAALAMGCSPAPGYQIAQGGDPLIDRRNLTTPFNRATRGLATGMIPAALVGFWLVWRRRSSGRTAAANDADRPRSEPPATASAGDAVVEPLRCSACAAAVPYSAGEQTICPHCQTRCPLPPAYRELAPLRRRAHAAAQAAARAWRTHRRLTSAVTVPLAIAAYLALMGGSVILGRACDHAPYHGYYITMSLALCFGCAGWLLSMTGAAVQIRRIDAAPLVLPPAERTGFGTCRTCSAPIALPAPAIVVAICGYCGTEHLIAGRAVRAAAVARGLEERRQQSLREASASLAQQIGALERGAAGLVIWYLLFAALWVAPA